MDSMERGRSFHVERAGKCFASGELFRPVLSAGSLAIRFIVAAFALVVLALRIRTPLMMLCMALGGFAGMHLWLFFIGRGNDDERMTCLRPLRTRFR